MSTSIGIAASDSLRNIQISPVINGGISGEAFDAGKLWSDRPAIIYVKGAFQGVPLVGIIKEVAPIKGAETDAVLGVEEFQNRYFAKYPVYIDHARSFYSFLGNKSLLAQPLHSWNPFTLYSDFQKLTARTKSKGLKGNLVGEGLIKGGLLIISPRRGLIYRHDESTGTTMPYEEIQAAVDALVAEEGPFEDLTPNPINDSGAEAVCSVPKAGEDCGCK